MSQNGFVRRRVLRVRPRGNLAGRMFQYMGALSLSERINDCTIENISIPEWDIQIPDDTGNQVFADRIDLWVADPLRANVPELTSMANRSESIQIMIDDHLMRMEHLSSPAFYNKIFRRQTDVRADVGAGDLVINIRGVDEQEVDEGITHHPLVPIDFYESLISQTGLQPVFMGQLDEGPYVGLLRERFPTARFIESQGPVADFDLIRQAHNVVVSVSSFAWLAAWLSEAKNIFLPVNGLFNPAHCREIDLLPIDDPRYRFFLFPLNYGLHENESIEHHKKLQGKWKEITRAQAAVLKTSAPFLTPRWARVTFDSLWYAHTYVDAAMEISEGWFHDPMHHYLELGRLRGYLPTQPLQADCSLDISLVNLALGKSATQSSVCQWSVGATIEDDARNAVNGNWQTEYAFHTDYEFNPWWMVDLEAESSIQQIRVFNRDADTADLLRASPLVAEVSSDGENWQQIFSTTRGQVFGGYRGSPLLWKCTEPVVGRYVRLSIPRREYLHLAEVEVYGHRLTDETESAPPPVDTTDGHTAAEADLRLLITYQGTAGFLAPESGDLQHGPLGSIPHNLALAQHGDKAYLLHITDGKPSVIHMAPSPDVPVENISWIPPETDDGAFDIVITDGPVIGLKRHGLFLCAEPDGRLLLSRYRLDWWESFTLGSAPEASRG